MKALTLALHAIAAATLLAVPGTGARAENLPMERAKLLSAFGERAAFSPDGSRVAFIGKSYGDAYEIELTSGTVRNLTSQFPHQGILRVQYLPNGDYLLSGPKRYIGPNSRINVDLFVLNQNLKTGLKPLGLGVFEGVAIGPENLIAWQQLPGGEGLKPGESWINAVGRIDFEHYVGRIAYEAGQPRIVERRRILENRPAGCEFAEVQDFRDNGAEVVFYCAGHGVGVASKTKMMGIYGYNLRTAKYIPYRPMAEGYAEVEGIAPDGKWTTVECGDNSGADRSPPLDICRLELKPGGKLTRLIIGTAPGSSKKISNPVVSPDGKSIAFQAADSTMGEPGEGGGIYLMPITP